MQIELVPRNVLTGPMPSGLQTRWTNVEGIPLIVAALNIYSLDGTGPSVNVLFETTDDGGETVASLTPSIAATTTGRFVATLKASSDLYGSQLRAVIQLTGTTPVCEYAIYFDAFYSS